MCGLPLAEINSLMMARPLPWKDVAGLKAGSQAF